MFYEVDIGNDATILLEGQASGAIAKGGDGNYANPRDALKSSVEMIGQVAGVVASQVAPTMVGSGCTFEVEFGVRADGNGTVMLSQTPDIGQFRCVVKWLPFGAG